MALAQPARGGGGNTNPAVGRYRSVLFTSFDSELRPQLSDCINFLVYQVERAPSTGKLHVQGYAEFNKQATLKTIKSALGDNSAHIEPRRGTPEQAIAYCSKEDTRIEGPWTFGESSGSYQGKRSDLATVSEKIINKVPMRSIAVEHPETYIRYNRGMEKLADMLLEDRDPNNPPVCIWIYGPTGSGKTSTIYKYFDTSEVYVKMSNNKWWDGYLQQRVVLLNEYKGGIDREDILQWFDRYPCCIERKGGVTKLNSPIMIVTSLYGPGYWGGEELARRFKVIIKLGE